MKKLFVLFLMAAMVFTLSACGDDPKPTEPTVDPVAEAKEKLSKAYDKYGADLVDGNGRKYAWLGDDGMSLTIDTNPKDNEFSTHLEDEATSAIVAANEYLGLPSSVTEKMGSTRAMDGMQTQDCGEYSVTWSYHPDNGLKVIYEVNE